MSAKVTARPPKLSPDPLLVEKVRDTVGLYMNPPDNTLVLCVDEKCQIAATSNKAGLRVRAPLDARPYPAGVKVTDAAVDMIHLKAARFHEGWNYTLVPTSGRG